MEASKAHTMEPKTAHVIEEKERTDDINIQENVTFSEMYLADAVLAGLHSSGFVRPSPIQLSAIPLGRCGLDLLVQAKSGTGKTCVFAVVALEMISVVAKATQVLVVAPTREIAVQITQVISHISSAMPDLKISCFIGGINLIEDKAKLNCHIAVGTPGRLNQLVNLGLLKLDNVRLLVLDEADQLLTGQFKDSIMYLVKTLPLNKQVLALSATFPDDVTKFLDSFMRSPSHVRLDKESLALIGVKQFVKILPDHPQPHKRHKIKLNELLTILSSVPFNQCLVFSNSQLRAESICHQLESCGWPASFLSGGQIQEERLRAFHALCSFKCRVLVSTDLSARGIDSEHVNLVINLDIPTDQATYLHRVGRAGRFGSKGAAISIVCEGEELESIRAISTLANLDLQILKESSDLNIALPDSDTLEKLEGLNKESCCGWLEKQNKKKSKYKPKTDIENKENDPTYSLSKLSLNLNEKKLKVMKGSKNVNELKGLNDDKGVCNTLSGKIKNNCSNNTIKHPQKGHSEKEKLEKFKHTLKDFIKEYGLNIFSNEDLAKLCWNEWENLSENCSPKIRIENLLNGYPDLSQFESLKHVLTNMHKNNDLSIMNLEEKVQDLTFDAIPALQKVLQTSEPFEALNQNENNPHAELFSEDFSTQLLNDFVVEDRVISHIDKGTTTELNEQKYSNEIEGKSLQNNYDANTSVESKCLNAELLNRNLDDKQEVQLNSVRPKNNKGRNKYSENTGYGMWEPVQKPNKKILQKYNTDIEIKQKNVEEQLTAQKNVEQQITPQKNLAKQKITKIKSKGKKMEIHKQGDYYPVKVKQGPPPPAKNYADQCKINYGNWNGYEQNKDDDDDCYSSHKNYYLPRNYSNDYNTSDVYFDNYNRSTDYYINSAKKFASMMNYVRTVGKMSASIANDYYLQAGFGHNLSHWRADIGDKQDS